MDSCLLEIILLEPFLLQAISPLHFPCFRYLEMIGKNVGLHPDWILGPSGSETLTCLVLNQVALLQTDLT